MPNDADEPVTITRAQLAQLNAANSFLGELTRDATAVGQSVRDAAKAKWPTVRFANDVADQYAAPLRAEIGQVNDKVGKLIERLDAEATSRSDAATEAAIRAELTEARTRYKFSDDGMGQVLARMKEKNNPDVLAAAAWVAEQQPKAQPATPNGFGPAALHLFGAGADSDDAEVQALHKDPVKWFDREVGDILGEFARGEHA